MYRFKAADESRAKLYRRIYATDPEKYPSCENHERPTYWADLDFVDGLAKFEFDVAIDPAR